MSLNEVARLLLFDSAAGLQVLAMLELFLHLAALDVFAEGLVAGLLRLLVIKHDSLETFDQLRVGHRPLRALVGQFSEPRALEVAN